MTETSFLNITISWRLLVFSCFFVMVLLPLVSSNGDLLYMGMVLHNFHATISRFDDIYLKKTYYLYHRILFVPDDFSHVSPILERLCENYHGASHLQRVKCVSENLTTSFLVPAHNLIYIYFQMCTYWSMVIECWWDLLTFDLLLSMWHISSHSPCWLSMCWWCCQCSPLNWRKLYGVTHYQ